MKDSQQQRNVQLWWRRPALDLGAVAVTLVVAISFAVAATGALAAGNVLTVSSASNSTLGEQITVDAQGRTLYALRPETRRHLLCKSTECLTVWRPLTVHSSKTKLKAGPGVVGHLAILPRAKGVLQVTLGGLPLYRYAGDSSKGEANGQGIHSFGGVWHVVQATGGTGSPTTTTPSTPTPLPGY